MSRLLAALLALTLFVFGCATAASPRPIQIITDPITGRVYRCVVGDPCDAPPSLVHPHPHLHLHLHPHPHL